MALSISRHQIDIGEVNLSTPGFRKIIEDHRILLYTDPSTVLTPLSMFNEYKYIGDFYQLLLQLNIPQDMHWIILRINNLASPIDYNGQLKQIAIPSRNTILHLLKKYLNKITLT